jgi:hypothetical protein
MAMPRPTIDFLNARRALKPASGGTNYRARERARYAPDSDEEELKWAEEERAMITAQTQRLIAEATSKRTIEYLLKRGFSENAVQRYLRLMGRIGK